MRDSYRILVGTPIAVRDNVPQSHLASLSSVVVDEADMLLTSAAGTPITAYLVPNLKARIDHGPAQVQ